MTGAFIETPPSWLEARARHRDELAALDAHASFDQRQDEIGSSSNVERWAPLVRW